VTDYIDLGIETDPEVIAQLGFDEMNSRIPGWDRIVGEIDTALIQANARIAAQVRASAGIVPVTVFRYLASQFGLAPRAGAPWKIVANILYEDILNHTMPAGTLFAVDAGGGDLRTFALTYDVVESDGDGESTNVQLQSVDLAQDNSDVLAGMLFQAIDALPYFTGGTVTVDAFGGQQSETDDEYFQRLIRRFALNTAAPILPQDFANLALDIAPIGSRAIAVDGYDAVALTSNNPRTVTVLCVDSGGNMLSPTMKADILAYIGSKRELNWNIYVADPVLFTISAKFDGKAIPGYAPADVLAAGLQTLRDYLHPKTWGTPAITTFGNLTMLEGWDKVRLGELYEVLNNVDGMAYLNSVNLVAGASAPVAQVADVSLSGGPVVLATFGSITGVMA
jgi:hypothetical protein